MKTSSKGVVRLVLREALKLKAYKDSAGVWTIGVGHTRTAKEGMVITKGKAASLLKEDLRKHERAVNRYVKKRITQDQFDCLVSFAFNVGNHAFKTSTLLKELNAGRFKNVPIELMRWNKITSPMTGKKVISAGLVYRRVTECAQWYARRIQKEYQPSGNATTEIIV